MKRSPRRPPRPLPVTTILAEAPPSTAARTWVTRLGDRRPRRGLVLALALSIGLHVALSFWPAEVPITPDDVPLQATITELPPPPQAAPVAAAKPRPKPRRATAPPVPVEVPEPVATSAPEVPATEPTEEGLATGPEPPSEVIAAASP